MPGPLQFLFDTILTATVMYVVLYITITFLGTWNLLRVHNPFKLCTETLLPFMVGGAEPNRHAQSHTGWSVTGLVYEPRPI